MEQVKKWWFIPASINSTKNESTKTKWMHNIRSIKRIETKEIKVFNFWRDKRKSI